MIELFNESFLDREYPKGITITDPPYNQNYKYSSYKDNLKIDEYKKLLSGIKKTLCNNSLPRRNN